MKPSPMTEVSSQESVSDDVKTCATSRSLDVLAHPESEPRSALEHSAAASKYLHQEDYDGAMRSYRQALHLYEQEDSSVGQCNAAATLHNMALLHKRCQRYTMAVRCFEEAEDIYRSVYSRIVPKVGEVEEGVCLEYLLIETLHNRAFLHSKYQGDVSRAIACNELAVETLLKEDDEQLSSVQPIPDNEKDVVFIKIKDAERIKLLVESLKNLCVLYSQRGEVEGALGAFEEALEFCRSEQVSDEEISKSMATVYIHLAFVYFEQEEFAEALENLQQAMNVWILRKEHPSHPEVFATINNMGLAHERMGNLDKALECYEDLLHVRSQFFGEDQVEVADSLSTVAKVLERQGNTEGALDLYQ
jgi:tetratricopeptide (TPR) repeat protein